MTPPETGSETGPGAAPPPIRDAATVILLRRDQGDRARVLMGMRGRKAAFMASKATRSSSSGGAPK